MTNQQEPESGRRSFQTGGGGTDLEDAFTVACDWGENWGRIALTSKTTGAEILIVMPFACDPQASPEQIERRLYDQARPQMAKAVRALISKAWPQE